MPLPDPLSLRLSEAHMAYLDEVRVRHSDVTRAAAIRRVLDEAMARDRRRLRAIQRRVAEAAAS